MSSMRGTAHGKQLHVLIGDTSLEERERLDDLLGASGFRVDLAADGFELLRSAREGFPDVIVLEVALPKLDGFR